MSPIDESTRRGSGGARRAVYRLSGASAQQAVLDDFRTAALSGVQALGVDDPEGPRIVVRCETSEDEVVVEHVVREIDPRSSRLNTGRGPMVHPSALPALPELPPDAEG